MFPSKGTTVWVNFRDKPYLGKVLQTSPELDMVCVRISNYLDHVVKNVENEDLFSHSCPESNTSVLQSCHSSVIITCGFDDIFPLDSTISHDFKRMHIMNDEKTIIANSICNESNTIPSGSSVILSKPNENCNDDKDGSFSNSFEIDNILNNSNDRRKQNCLEHKIWKCRLCNTCIVDENNMNHHILNEHKVESHLGSDNWIVIGGVRGFEYEEVKYEDYNIKSVNNVPLSNNGRRKRQFSDFTSSMNDDNSELSFNRDLQFIDCFETSIKSDRENSFNACKANDIHCQQIIHKSCSLANEIWKFSVASLNDTPPIHLNYSTDNRNNECMEDIQNHNELYQRFVNDRKFPLVVNQPSFINSLPPTLFSWSERFRSNSFSANDQMNITNTTASPTDYEPMFALPKRSRVESSNKKCRKMYGIEQRHLWCNQCKWKKACSRFCHDMNTSV